MNIRFFWNITESRSFLKNRTYLKNYLIKQFKKEKKDKGSEVNIIFCTDDFLLDINKKILKHNYYTDIITFELNKTPLFAEIYISVDRVKENALIHKTTIKEEIHRVIFHGCLHLLGFKDKTNKEQVKMRQMEDKWISQYFN